MTNKAWGRVGDSPLIGAGTGPIVAGSPGTLGQCWTSNGASADATFQACPGGSATQTNSLLWVPSDGNVSQSVPEASGVIFCYAFPLAAPAQFTTAYQYISGAVPASVYGVAIYDASGNRLTAATQTGTLTSSTGPFHSAFGGGTLTLTPSTAGKFSLCYTSSAGVGLAFVSPPAQLSGYIQPSGNPVFFTGAVANPATFNGATITWPTTLGTPISVTGGSGNFPTTLLLP